MRFNFSRTRIFAFLPVLLLLASVAAPPSGMALHSGLGTQWQSINAEGAPSGRYGHTAVWTGSEFLVWGGYATHQFFNTGGRYNPETGGWASVSAAGAPIGRLRHAAIWTGGRMIVWGGESAGDGVTTDTGGIYDPNTDTWLSTSLVGAPSPRQQHTAIWTGSEMIVFGGCPTVFCGSVFSDGARYDPTSDTWSPLPPAPNAIARHFHEAVWTGQEMILWGGTEDRQGLAFNPSSNAWRMIALEDAPAPTFQGASVWTGTEMIVWAGCAYYSTTACTEPVGSGARFNPSLDKWTALPTELAPAPRYYHSVAWTGDIMLVWGGCGGGCFSDGAAYRPETDSWSALETDGAPSARAYHRVAWTGKSMVLWGGCSDDMCSSGYLQTGAQYTLPPQRPIVAPSISEQDVVLHWKHDSANTAGYEVWISEEPYFEPGKDGQAETVGSAAVGALQEYLSTGAADDTEGNLTYVVIGTNHLGQRSEPSGRIGEFGYPLVSGS